MNDASNNNNYFVFSPEESKKLALIQAQMRLHLRLSPPPPEEEHFWLDGLRDNDDGSWTRYWMPKELADEWQRTRFPSSAKAQAQNERGTMLFRSHDEATAERFSRNPALAAELLAQIANNPDEDSEAVLAITKRQITMAYDLADADNKKALEKLI